MKFAILGLMIAITAPSAFAADNISKSCADAVLESAYTAFAEAAGIEVNAVDDIANVNEPFIEEGDEANQISVQFDSRDIYAWDGYAKYRVTVKARGETCKAGKAELISSEGI